MDKVHAYIEEEREFYRHKTRRDLLEHIATVSGTFWIEDELEPWERMVHWPELELLSAFEFLRPELSEEELGILDGWIAKYAGWREQGIFFQRYQETKGSRFTWKKYRERMEEEFGRLIPRSHWWFWPDDKRGES